MSNAAPPPPDTSEMLAVHRVFREALGNAGQLVGGVREGDTARAGHVAGYYHEVLTLLRLHHDGEDELVWPKLLDRAPGQAGLVRSSERQHQEILDPLERAGTALTTWEAAPGPGSGEALVAALGELRMGLVAHLDNEERTVLPLIAEHLTVEEWDELPAHSMQNYPGERVWLLLGLVREHMTQAQRDLMLVHMPPPAVEMWTTKGEDAFNAYMAEVRGG
ncbi:MAG: hemerythrin domain-containing protein [Acidimicrobiales bacterium]